MPVPMQSSSIIPEVIDSETIFTKYHVGEVERILHKLEGERRRVQQDLSLLVGQHYTKIIEASNAVDEMKNSASVMDELFRQLTSFSISSGAHSTHVEDGCPSQSTTESEKAAYEDYELAWNLLFDGKLSEAAKILKEKKVNSHFQSAIKCLNNESTRILSNPSICDPSQLFRAVQAECLLGNLEPFDVLKAHLDYTLQFLPPDRQDFVQKIRLICECCVLLNLAEYDVLSLLNMVTIPEEQDDLLWSAMELDSSLSNTAPSNQSIPHKYSTRLFTVWLRCLPLKKTTKFSDVFDLAFKVSSVNNGFICPEWQQLAKEHFSQAILEKSSQLLVYPILGSFTLESTAAEIPETMESYLIPSSKCKIEKLTLL